MDQEYLDKFEGNLRRLLAGMLVSCGAVDEFLPDAPDIEARWEGICTAYLPDGAREFSDYPTVSLGWMMFIGMAVARMWDEDWEMYSRFNDIYHDILLKGRGYDAMDEYILQDILKVDAAAGDKLSGIAGDAAQMAHNLLIHEGFEPGTPSAFNAYVRCLHQLYYFGAAMELKSSGYQMVKV